MLDTSLTKALSRRVAAMLTPIITAAFAGPAQAQEITLSVSGIVSDVDGNDFFTNTFADAPGSVVHGSVTYECPSQDLIPAVDRGLYILNLIDASASISHQGDSYVWSAWSPGASFAITDLNSPGVDDVPTGVGNGICEMNEGCVNGDHNLTETTDCEGVTSGPLDEQYCFVEGVCVDNTTDPNERSPCPNPPPGPESLTVTAALTGPQVDCESVDTSAPGQFPSEFSCTYFDIRHLVVFLGDRYGNGLTSDRHPSEIVLSDWHHKEAALVFDGGKLGLFVLSMSATGSCPGVPVAGNLSTYLGPTPPPSPNSAPPLRWPQGNGVMPITVAGSAEVDVRLLDARSVRIGPNRAPLTGNGQLVRQDFNGDGHLDARGNFQPSEAGLNQTSTELCTSVTFMATTVHSCTELSPGPVVDDDPIRTQQRTPQ